MTLATGLAAPTIAVVQMAHAQGLPLPAYETSGAAGMDLRAAVEDEAPVVLRPGSRAMVPTGLCIAVPAGFEVQVRPRSGLAAKAGITCLNSPGTVDAGYRGEIKVSLINLDPATPIAIRRGDRIAQLLVQRVELPELVEVASFDEAGLADTTRGQDGHGSSGGHASL